MSVAPTHAQTSLVVLATTNAHKIEEFRALLAAAPCQFVAPTDLGAVPPWLEETGDTFQRNAALKALAYAQAFGLPALADDSGLEIDALNGEPGVRSARWAGEAVTYPERFRLLFARLAAAGALTPARRAARYRCSIALAEPAPYGLYTIVDGTFEGYISDQPRGSGGFGYDPIFFAPQLGRTVGEASAEEKHRVSHRGQAARAALDPLRSLLAARARRLAEA